MSVSIAKLIFEQNGIVIKKLLLVKDNPTNITIGKNNDCKVIFSDPEVSRTHAQINFNGNQISINDLNSTNGTYLNNSKIQSGRSYSLNVGDYVTFSNTGNSRLSISNPSVSNIQRDHQISDNSSNYKSNPRNVKTYLMWGAGITIALILFFFLTREIDPLKIKLRDLKQPCDYVDTDLKILEDYYEILESNEGEDVSDWDQKDKKRAKKLKKRSWQINDRANNKLDIDEREDMEDCDNYKTRKRLKEDIQDLEKDINDVYLLDVNSNSNNNSSLNDE